MSWHCRRAPNQTRSRKQQVIPEAHTTGPGVSLQQRSLLQVGDRFSQVVRNLGLQAQDRTDDPILQW